MKFIHAADLHLDSPFGGLKNVPNQLMDSIYQSTFKALSNLVDTAIKESVDFVCLVGDLYDSDEMSIMAQTTLIDQCERLQKAGIAVYLSFGNHDFSDNSQNHLAFPPNVTLFTSEVETVTHLLKNGDEVQLTGFSYAHRWEPSKIADYPIRGNEKWHIGLIHGANEGVSSTSVESYAPFTVKELLQKNYDYWGLGHIHVRQVLNEMPPVIYPGNTQGRHRKESGDKGFYLVSSEGSKLVPEFVTSSTIDWETVDVSMATINSLSDAIDEIDAECQKFSEDKAYLMVIQLTDLDDFSDLLLNRIQNGDLLTAWIQKHTPDNYYWLVKIKMLVNEKVTFESIDQEYWEESAKRVFTNDKMTELADKLLQIPELNTYLLGNGHLSELQESAKVLLRENQAIEGRKNENN
ncbi:metallophosphoesterase family protein [Dellaglioa sp. L3N]